MALLLLVKASLVLAIVLGAAKLLRRTPAITRHGLWSLGFGVLLVLPLLSSVLPAIDIRIPAAWESSLMGPAVARTSPAPAPTVHENAQPPRMMRAAASAGPQGDTGVAATTPFRMPQAGAVAFLLTVWGVGSVAAVSMLLLSLLRVRRLAASATELTDPDWLDAAERLRRRIGLGRRIRLVVSDRVRTPMAGGLTRPAVFLPTSAATWTTERRDVVLAHEIAHLAGADPLRHVAARLAVALYWFHPLAWLAAREAAVAREQACDETVLALGTRPSSYAQVLLDFADAAGAAPLGALPIADRSLLETRLMAILAHEPRHATRPRPLVPLATIAAIAIAIAAAQPAAPLLSTVQASPVPPDAPATQRTADTVEMDCTGRHDAGGTYDRIAVRDADRFIVRSIGDLQLCMSAAGVPDDSSRPSEWMPHASRMVLESRRGSTVQRLETMRQAGGAPRVVWSVGGAERPFDAMAEEWRAKMLAVLDVTWELATLHGKASTLRGGISMVHGEQNTLRGEIATLVGELNTLQGRISSIRGEESTLRGEISTIEGQLNTLLGSISTERGSLAALEAARAAAEAVDRTRLEVDRRAHEQEIAKLEREIREFAADKKILAVEARLRALDADRKIAEIEKAIETFDIVAKVADVEKRIQDLDVAATVALVERTLAELNAGGRARTLEERLAFELRRFQELLAKIK